MQLLDYFIKKKIPDEIKSYERKVMHITDTPDVSFAFIKAVIRLVQPDIIIHTGDMVDNIKLEFSHKEIDIYEMRLISLLKIMKSSSAEKIILCDGNHDDAETVLRHIDDDIVFKQSHQVILDNFSLSIAHKIELCESSNVDMCLFGHSPDVLSQLNQIPKLLNGLDCIYIINSITGEIASIDYPKDTDYFRQKKFKLGL